MQKIKSIVVVIMVITATVLGLTACRNCCNKDGKCKREMCCSKDCCKHCDGKACCDGKDCKEKCEKMCSEGKCCKKDSASCMKDGKKDCCKKDSMSMKGMSMYACPMHKDITSDKPGKCTKCGMEMEKAK